MIETMRIAEISDAEAVTALTRMAYAKWIPVIGREPLPVKADHAAFITEHRVDLLFCGAELVALVETIQCKEDILIENVAVDPRFQKRGYGRKMLIHAEQLAVQAGLDVVRLYTNSLFEENIRFYNSLGYEFEYSEERNGGVIIHMRKRVTWTISDVKNDN
ncbi:GNAT family N-acetyltransferase [Kosakonia cowanii]|uniref:GNAT family N-acetyltransferase n=1 Tax=Kosakonia cowanii TaxID=208223 RepID=UPI00345BBB6D